MQQCWALAVAADGSALNLLPAGAGADVDGDALQLGAALRIFDLDDRHVGADEIRLGLIKRNKTGHFQRQALLVIGRGDLALLQRDGAVGGLRDQPDRGQGSRGAIGLHVEIDADLDSLGGRALGPTADGGDWMGPARRWFCRWGPSLWNSARSRRRAGQGSEGEPKTLKTSRHVHRCRHGKSHIGETFRS